MTPYKMHHCEKDPYEPTCWHPDGENAEKGKMKERNGDECTEGGTPLDDKDEFTEEDKLADEGKSIEDVQRATTLTQKTSLTFRCHAYTLHHSDERTRPIRKSAHTAAITPRRKGTQSSNP